MRWGVIIPAYNADQQLPVVLLKILDYIPAERIVVVDDGSTDKTASIARASRVGLISHGKNLGKGRALRSGFQWAIQQGHDAVFTIDGDGQHDPDRIPDFIDRMIRSHLDMVIGVRPFVIGRMPVDRILSNRLSSLITSVVAGQWIPDSQCGYRLIRCGVLNNLRLISDRFEIETELVIRAKWKGCKISFCPVSPKYGKGGSHIHRLSDTVRFLRLIGRLIKERI